MFTLHTHINTKNRGKDTTKSANTQIFLHFLTLYLANFTKNEEKNAVFE